MSIMPPEPDSQPEPTLTGIAALMSKSADPFTSEAAGLIGYIGTQHEYPVTCDECARGGGCLMYESAVNAAFAWLLKVIDERG